MVGQRHATVPFGFAQSLMAMQHRFQGGSVGLALDSGHVEQPVRHLQPGPHGVDKGGVTQQDLPTEFLPRGRVCDALGDKAPVMLLRFHPLATTLARIHSVLSPACASPSPAVVP